MSDSQIIQVLSNSDIFQLATPINLILRFLGWELIKILAFLSNGVEKVVNEIYSLNGFFSSKYVTGLINDLLPLIWVVLAISIAFLGFKIIFDREFKINNLIKNIVISVSLVMLLPMGMNHLEKITSQAVSGLKTEYKLSANKIIKENFYDLYYLDKQNFSTKSRNNIPVDRITSNIISINEEIDDSEVENKDVFKYKVTTDLSGKNIKQKLQKTFFGLFSESYYRFNFSFWGIFISLACTTVTLLATSFKVARIIFELGFVKLFGILYSFADISNGQKTKEVIRCIVSNFAVLFLISVLLKMYLLFTTWSIEQSTSLTQTVLLIGASIAVVDGPNIIERILGIDSGVKSGWSVVTAGYATAKGLANGSKGASDIMGKAFSGVGNLGSGAVGMVNGLREGAKSLEEQMSEGVHKGKNNDDEQNSNIKASSSIHDEIEANKSNNSSNDSSNDKSTENNIKDANNIASNNNLDNISSVGQDTLLDDNNQYISANTADMENATQGLNDNIDSNTLHTDMNQAIQSKNINSDGNVPSLESSMNGTSGLSSDIKPKSDVPSLESAMSGKSGLSPDTKPKSDVPSLESAMSGKSGLSSDIKPKSDVPSLENAMNDTLGISSDPKPKVSSLSDDMIMKNDDLNKTNGSSSLESELVNNKLSSPVKDSNSFNSEIVDKSSHTENLTLASHLKNNMRANPIIKNMQQSYTIGKNTGLSIADFKKNRKAK